jgi:hypothetical protein
MRPISPRGPQMVAPSRGAIAPGCRTAASGSLPPERLAEQVYLRVANGRPSAALFMVDGGDHRAQARCRTARPELSDTTENSRGRAGKSVEVQLDQCQVLVAAIQRIARQLECIRPPPNDARARRRSAGKAGAAIRKRKVAGFDTDHLHETFATVPEFRESGTSLQGREAGMHRPWKPISTRGSSHSASICHDMAWRQCNASGSMSFCAQKAS